MRSGLPPLYAVVDPSLLNPPGDLSELSQFVVELMEGGIKLLQYRNKKDDNRLRLSQAREIVRVRNAFQQKSRSRAVLIMNDRPDLCLAADFDGVHVGQTDISPRGARLVVASEKIVGVSTHNPEQVKAADKERVNYIAIGPVFQTSSKENPGPVIGLDGVREARRWTDKPLVAIGGITRENCAKVREAGADCVAVISDLISNPRKSVEEFLRVLR